MRACVIPSFSSLLHLIPAALLLAACGGAASGPENAGEASSDNWSGDDANSSTAAGSPEAEAAGPDCSDGTCFSCGDGVCPQGAYCDADASGGPACAWIAECSGSPDCACLTSVLGAACSCEQTGGGLTLSCQ